MMERALKERIIGAAVLVLFVVLVVPVFLDGPPDAAEIVSESVLLPGQEDQKTHTVVLERNRTEPVPAATAPDSGSSQATPKSAEPKEQKIEDKPPVIKKESELTPKIAAPPPKPRINTAPPAASTTGMWAVQLGSFSNKENAEKLAADLRKRGYAAFLSQLTTDSGKLHRVRIGPQKDRESAAAMASRLLKADHEGQVVPHP